VNEQANSAGYELRTIHVPKTIDNDLVGTDHCPGFGSAGKFVAQAFAGANQDNRALPGVYIAVVMGRHAGFLTAASVLARKFPDDGPHSSICRAPFQSGEVHRRRGVGLRQARPLHHCGVRGRLGRRWPAGHDHTQALGGKGCARQRAALGHRRAG